MKAFKFIVVAIVVIAVAAAGCGREVVQTMTEYQEQSTPVDFSVYASGTATKAANFDAKDVLGEWSGGAFIPGEGIGVFAFFQPAKSNGYPVLFNKNTGEPTFMYNQKLERLTDDGVNFRFDYSPRKYWSPRENDLVSFFAYAPYDRSTAWEDLDIKADLKGIKLTRDFTIENDIKEQTDIIWCDPRLNMERPDPVTTPVHFDFRHRCARISFEMAADIDGDGNPDVWTDPDSEFEVMGLDISSVHTVMHYSYLYDEANDNWDSNWTAEGSQNLIFTADNFAVSKVDTAWTTAEFKMINAEDSYLMLAPQNLAEQNAVITFRYSFATTNPLNGRVTTQKVTRVLSLNDLLSDHRLKSGYAYKVKFLFTLTGEIKFSINVENWPAV